MSEIWFSEVLKKYKEKDACPPPRKKGSSGSKDPQEAKDIRLSSIVRKELSQHRCADASQLQGLYDAAFVKVTQLYQSGAGKEQDIVSWMRPAADAITDYFNSGEKDLLRLSLGEYPVDEEYLVRHPVNVGIFAAFIGLGSGLARERVIELAITGFVHDIGMLDCRQLADKKGALTPDEFAKVKEHPEKSFEALKKNTRDLPAVILEAVRQEHERMDGSGYPNGLKDDQVSEYARIIGLADVYEAMTHRRPYRESHTPVEAIRIILENKNSFSPDVTKTLIERVGIFPLGLLVELNTQEIGVVLKNNVKLPLRPLIEIVIDAQGQELKVPKQVDLADNSIICIEECLDYLPLCLKK
jgi:HD-GYP domain-containing protein (c-di-GMP phosphodiesterase class II)